MENYWSMFKDWALWLASPTLGVSLFMSPSLLLSFLQLLVKTAHGNDATSPHRAGESYFTAPKSA